MNRIPKIPNGTIIPVHGPSTAGIWMDKEEGLVKVNPEGTPKTLVDTDSTQTLTNKTLALPVTLTGMTLVDCTIENPTFSSTYWRDLEIAPSAMQFAGSSDPALKDWQPGGSGTTFKVWEFNTNDEAFFVAQLPPDYKEGTDVHPHLHWTPADRGTAENGKTVNWRLDISVANRDAAFPASTTYVLTDTCDGVNSKNHTVEATAEIPGTGLQVGALLVARIYRAAGDTWATNTAGNCPVLLQVDCHYQVNNFGFGELDHP